LNLNSLESQTFGLVAGLCTSLRLHLLVQDVSPHQKMGALRGQSLRKGVHSRRVRSYFAAVQLSACGCLDEERAGTVSALLCSTVSGINILVARIGTGFLPQVFYTSISMFTAGLVGWILVFLRPIRGELAALSPRMTLKMLVIGAGVAAAFLSMFTGVSLTAVSNSFLLQTEVIYAMVCGYLLLKERISWGQVAASLVLVTGDVMVMTEGLIQQANVGDFLFLVAPFFFTVTNIMAKDVMKTVDPSIVVAFRYMSGGLLLLFVQALMGIEKLVLGMESSLTLLVLIQGLLLATSSLFSHLAMKMINISKASAIFLTYPVISAIVAILFLGEKVTPVRSVGAAMIFISVLYIARLRSTTRDAARSI